MKKSTTNKVYPELAFSPERSQGVERGSRRELTTKSRVLRTTNDEPPTKNKVQRTNNHEPPTVSRVLRTINNELRTTDPALERRVCEDCRFSVAAEVGEGLLFTCDEKRPGHRLIVRCDEACKRFVRSQDLLAPYLVKALAEGAKLLPLTQGRFAIVDAEDYAELSRYKWCVVKTPYTCYAVRATRRKRVKGNRTRRKTILMHRAVTAAPKGLLVDHINHNGLDNRKKNLRLCTKSQNTRNQLPRPGCSSRYKGVSWKKRDKKFVAQITFRGKKFHLGSFDDEVAAAKAYDKKAKELFGEFAYLNFP